MITDESGYTSGLEATPSPQTQIVGVKALGWVTCGDVAFCSTPFGSYEVRPSRSSRFTGDRYELLVPGEKFASVHFATETLGREAAEADFKHRVLSCIVFPSPQSNADGKCPHCDGTGDASEKGRIEQCCACEGTGNVAPVDVYRILKQAADNGTLDRDHITALSRKIAALYPSPQTRVRGIE